MVETQLAQKVPAAAAGRSPPSSKPSVTQAAGKTAGGKGAPVAKAGPASKAGTATAVDVATLLPAGPHKQVGCIKPSSCQPFFEGNIGVPELVRAHGSPMSKSRQVRARARNSCCQLAFHLRCSWAQYQSHLLVKAVAVCVQVDLQVPDGQYELDLSCPEQVASACALVRLWVQQPACWRGASLQGRPWQPTKRHTSPTELPSTGLLLVSMGCAGCFQSWHSLSRW